MDESGRKWRGGIEMFKGEYNHTIDAKGRLIIPSKFRELLGEDFVITKGLDHCLSVYPKTEWEKFEEKLNQLPMTNKAARKFVRANLSGASSCELDKQGRILVPGVLREYASLDKEVAVIGVSNRVEIWSKDLWEAYINDEEEDMDSLAEHMEDLGF